jgi:hypothetical protein
MFKTKMILVCLEVAVITGVIGCDPYWAFLSYDETFYQNNKLYAMSNTDVNEVYIATLAAMDKLHLQVDKTKKDSLSAQVIAKSTDGRLITITMIFWGHDNEGHKRISYNIQVGAHGDEECSRKIYNEIVAELPIVKTK